MEWLRCNKCYRLMEKSARTFIMTQCSHVFCDRCLTPETTVCHECGSIDFATVELTYPPKLETMINYFSPLTDFMASSQKKIQFHEEQLAICLRGSAEAEKKYENMKILFSTLTDDMKALSTKYKKLQEESRKLDLAMQMESPSTEESCPNNPRRMESSKPPKIKFADVPINPGYLQNQRRKMEQPTTSGNRKISTAPISNYSYNPRPPFSTSNHHSSGSLDSGNQTIPVTPGQGLFLVPKILKVPKSAITVQNRKLKMLRISNEKREEDL